MSTIPAKSDADGTPGFPGVSFGRSMEGHTVARVGDAAFAMLPGRGERHYLATGWKIAAPLSKWRRADFHGHSGDLADEAAFRARVFEHAEHQRESRGLGRCEISARAYTPWGLSQHTTVYADGVERHSTASHGGFRLSPLRNCKVHPSLRVEDGFYEEDCAWAAVAITFPDLFTGFERRCAEVTIRDWQPAAWEKIFGRVLAPGQSHAKDRRAFETQHANDWIVISALRSNHHPGMTEVIATRGGQRDAHLEERRFLVPAAEYGVGRFGFVIDETRHAAYDGPSSFVTWSGKCAT
ncbi:hypothetical protein EPK99_23255 [Neorhizobium lilium]|uniref:DUF7007 domain-containing protein n=1 Tax=Neorhizobium lilium TaxID=2503024 RepID=A0A3S4UIU0_9HYPH|nr:hypothetical protein [Neorhizobium lilium]RWX74817.1 hypothetical protein EPK99_23255 [Neorhizobium lilium]